MAKKSVGKYKLSSKMCIFAGQINKTKLKHGRLSRGNYKQVGVRICRSANPRTRRHFFYYVQKYVED